MKKQKSAKGVAFKKRLVDAGYKQAEFARVYGLKNSQALTNWFNRGVPTEEAVAVASILGCDPDEISDIKVSAPSTADSGEIEVKAIKNRLRDKISNVKDLKYLRMIEAVIDSAGNTGQ